MILLIKKINFQVLISYLGIFPFFLVIVDILTFNIFNKDVLKDFIFFYTLLIFVFIGAIRWNLVKISNIYQIFFGFYPSLLSSFLILFYLINHNINFVFILLISLLNIQLLGDFIFSKYYLLEKIFFFQVRLPITTIITFILFYLISV